MPEFILKKSEMTNLEIATALRLFSASGGGGIPFTVNSFFVGTRVSPEVISIQERFLNRAMCRRVKVIATKKEWSNMTDREIAEECSKICGRFSDQCGDKKELEKEAKEAIKKRMGTYASVSFSDGTCGGLGRMVMGMISGPRGNTISFS